MYWFLLYYLLIFFVEIVILVVIFYYWRKYLKSVNVLVCFEYLILEYNKGEFLIEVSVDDFFKRLEVLLDCYN